MSFNIPLFVIDLIKRVNDCFASATVGVGAVNQNDHLIFSRDVKRSNCRTFGLIEPLVFKIPSSTSPGTGMSIQSGSVKVDWEIIWMDLVWSLLESTFADFLISRRWTALVKEVMK